MHQRIGKKNIFIRVVLFASFLLLSMSLNASFLWHDKRPEVASVRLQRIIQLQSEDPCVGSLFGFPRASCMPWEPNIDAGAVFEPARRYFFAGSAQSNLQVIDADTGDFVTKIPAAGRVITDARFNEARDVIYFGTDKGRVHCLDAFSFKSLFAFQADSKINNDILSFGDSVIFSTSLGTVYALDSKTGTLKWTLERNSTLEKLRMVPRSNIILFDDYKRGSQEQFLLVPHFEGYVSLINASAGREKKKIVLESSQNISGFPDIVAPMVRFDDVVWISSYDGGLFKLDLKTRKIRKILDLRGISQLAFDGEKIFAAGANQLVAISKEGKINWRNDFSKDYSNFARLSFPFGDLGSGGSRRMFFGEPSRLLFRSRMIIMATYSGSFGLFNKDTGKLANIFGNCIGFGSRISWAGANKVIAVSKRGGLYEFEISFP